MATMQRLALIIGGAYGLLAVAAGAFGAHALEGGVEADMLAVWHTAATYQMYHAIVLVVLGVWASRSTKAQAAAVACFTIGVLIFSGSLYLLVSTEARWLGAVTPIGGVLLMAGWGCVMGAGIATARSRKRRDGHADG